ncbi:MAG: hypothetical protein AAGA03_06510 [Planctomycetota bacterium]
MPYRWLLTIFVLFGPFDSIGLAVDQGSRSEFGDLPPAGQHDMLLLLPDGPLHMRLHLSDGGRSLAVVRQQYLERLNTALDVDQDGKVSRDETRKHPLFATSGRFAGNSFLQKLRTRRPYAQSEIERAVQRAAGQLVTYRQNNALAEQDMGVFGVLDEDQSGLIERAEMRLAPARIAARDSDFDHCVTFDEFVSDPPDDMANVVVNPLDSEPPGSVHAELLRDASEPILPARLVGKYDKDRDAFLTAEELGWTNQRVQLMDTDQDGKLSRQELSRIALSQPDLTLSVDLAKPTQEGMAIQDSTLDESQLIVRGDLVRMKRSDFSLSVGYQFRDPLEEAKTNASEAFNAIDVDANGYLDREEIAEHQRFQRYLFDAMDRDEDDRVFADEMLTYVREYTEPASTSCQVTLLDTGNGVFQMLDINADGLISIRELRRCEQSLLDAAGEPQQLNPSRLSKAYRIEIKRGGVSLFGRVDRPSAQSPTAQLKPPSGPMWFQRMDRNGDGDLTWDEFLGPREVFHQLDQDQDDLIDESEASKAPDQTT